MEEGGEEGGEAAITGVASPAEERHGHVGEQDELGLFPAPLSRSHRHFRATVFGVPLFGEPFLRLMHRPRQGPAVLWN